MSIKYAHVLRKNTHTNIKSIYANVVCECTTMKTIAKAISAATTVTYPDVLAVIKALEEKIHDEFLEGRGVSLDLLGTFYPTLMSKGAEDTDHFTKSKIQKVRIRFRPETALLMDINSNARFEKTLTKDAVNKAMREREEELNAEAEDSRKDGGDDGE